MNLNRELIFAVLFMSRNRKIVSRNRKKFFCVFASFASLRHKKDWVLFFCPVWSSLFSLLPPPPLLALAILSASFRRLQLLGPPSQERPPRRPASERQLLKPEFRRKRRAEHGQMLEPLTGSAHSAVLDARAAAAMPVHVATVRAWPRPSFGFRAPFPSHSFALSFSPETIDQEKTRAKNNTNKLSL